MSFRPISPQIPDNSFGRTERFIDKCSVRLSPTTKELKQNSTLGPGTVLYCLIIIIM